MAFTPSAIADSSNALTPVAIAFNVSTNLTSIDKSNFDTEVLKSGSPVFILLTREDETEANNNLITSLTDAINSSVPNFFDKYKIGEVNFSKDTEYWNSSINLSKDVFGRYADLLKRDGELRIPTPSVLVFKNGEVVKSIPSSSSPQEVLKYINSIS
ncbi:hypothetical protein NUACC21_58210 [Scytonema sp. NUACC21]